MSTPDELTRFAATQLGLPLRYLPMWDANAQTSKPAWFVIGESGDMGDVFEPLVSWEWLGRGLYMFHQQPGQWTAKIDTLSQGIWLYSPNSYQWEGYVGLEIPAAFWQCWCTLMKMEEP